MPTHESKSIVTVVMCTYNGAAHVSAQVKSLAAQTWPIQLIVFDDASSDDTVDLIEQHAAILPNLEIHRNTSNIGYVANFESGIRSAVQRGCEYIALSDQDDLWDKERIAKAMMCIQDKEKQIGTESAILTHSDLKMIDENDQPVHDSFLTYRHYEINENKNLATVLGQNGVMGNTVLMNHAMAKLALPFPTGLHVHDYWIAVLAELFGHRVMLPENLVHYRIHDANASNSSGQIKFGLQKLLDGKSWKGFVERDYRLPFKEDSRQVCISKLLHDNKDYPPLSNQQIELLNLFNEYLTFTGSRPAIFFQMLKAGFFRKGIRHRLRLAYSTLLTNRYKG